MPDITFEEPPVSRRSAPNHEPHEVIAATLRERPGQWAAVDARDSARRAAGAANAIVSAKLKAYAPARSFEAMARSVDVPKDGERIREYRVYARYVGEPR